MSTVHQYVPAIECTKEFLIPSTQEIVNVQEASITPILFVGDQLTVARGRGAKLAKVNSSSPTGRFEGLRPACADWHTRVILLEVRLYTA